MTTIQRLTTDALRTLRASYESRKDVRIIDDTADRHIQVINPQGLTLLMAYEDAPDQWVVALN